MRKGIGSADYWERVALLREISAQKHAGRAEAELRRIYSGTVKDIDEEIRKIFNRYSKDLDLTQEEAERLINAGISDKISLRLQELLARTKDPQQRNELMKRIHAQAYGARISRLEAVKQNIYMYFAEKGIREIETTKPVYDIIVEESYYRTVHDIAKGCDTGINFSLIPKRAIDEIVEAPWHGVQFSRRVWNNVNNVAEKAQEIVVRGLMGHKSYAKMAQELRDVENTTYYNASRLVRTQADHFLNLAEVKVYDELGIEEYRYLATLDERTCEKCAPLDNRIFKTSERVEGMNFPTIHPNCRCTFTMSTEYARRWARDPLTGKGHKIDNMSYDEWISSMTDEQREAFEKRVKDVKIFYRRNSDREQYDRYVKVLGAENMPKTFDKFVGMKYNDDRAEYEKIKKSYKTIGEINRKSWNDSFKEKARKSYFDFKNRDIEMSSHAISRFLSRQNGTNGISFTFDDIVNRCNLRANYVQTDGRKVKFYNNIAIIYNSADDTVVSIVKRKNPKKDWREI